MECSNCGHWNGIPVNKIFIEQPSPEPKAKVMIPMYKPLQVSKCEKCGEVIVEPKEKNRSVKKNDYKQNQNSSLFSLYSAYGRSCFVSHWSRFVYWRAISCCG